MSEVQARPRSSEHRLAGLFEPKGIALVGATADRPAARAAAAAALDLDPDRVTLLVTGGSLGAQRLNHVMASFGATLASLSPIMAISARIIRCLSSRTCDCTQLMTTMRSPLVTGRTSCKVLEG